MKTIVNRSLFIETFKKTRPNNFSDKGLHVLYDFLIELEENIGEEIELDVIAICCDFTEATHEDVRSDYNLGSEVDVLEYLNDNTLAISIDENTVIYQNF